MSFLLHPQKLQSLLIDAPDYLLHFYETCDSTHTQLKTILKNTSQAHTCWHLVTTREQTAGRGRFNNNWQSPKDKNLALSMGRKITQPLPHFSVFSVNLGLLICEVLSEDLPKVQLKWPNDLVFENQKLGGLLIEGVWKNQELTELLVGVGLNVNSKREDFASSIRKKTTSLYQLTHQYYDLNWKLKQVFDCIVRVCTIDTILIEKWEHWHSLRHEKAHFIFQGKKIMGEILGLNPDGSLNILVDGKLKTIFNAEIQL